MVGAEEKRCSHCGSSHTAGRGWRSHPTSGQRFCNACRVYADRCGGQLPPDSVLQRRKAQPRRMADVQKDIPQRRCLQCGSANPGRARGRTGAATPPLARSGCAGPAADVFNAI